jgi:hypothetical protein
MQMKKKLLIAIPIAAAVLGISTGVGVAFANSADHTANSRTISDNTTTTVPGTPGDSNGVGYCGGYNGMMGQVRGAVTQVVANAVDTTVTDLEAQLNSGKTLVEIAAAKGISQDQLITSLMAPVKDQTALMLKYGFMTQAQVDTMTQQLPAMLQIAINSKLNTSDAWNLMESMTQKYGGGMMGGWGSSAQQSGTPGPGFGGMMGGWGSSQAQTATPNSQQPATTNSPRSGFGGMMGRW